MSSAQQPMILIVDDRENMLRLLTKVLAPLGQVSTAQSGEAAIEILRRQSVDVVLSDIKMADASGLDVLRASKSLCPATEVILMTAYASLDSAIEALRLGAFDYLSKPFDPEHAKTIVLKALNQSRRVSDVVQPELAPEEVLPGVISQSSEMRRLAELLLRFADSDVTVLLMGETGTGKELMAKALHAHSPRRSERLVAVNCAAIPGELLESELFGFSKGSFTGASRDRRGLFEQADGGTLFLDEIGELPLPLQAKLTRALEERAVRRLGESQERKADARLVAATHRDLESDVKEGRFRSDLWYRLNVAALRIPPLRARVGDVKLLAEYFLQHRHLLNSNRGPHCFSPQAMGALEAQPWPGNVRQLRAAVERAAVVATGTTVELSDLSEDLTGNRAADVDLASLKWREAQDLARESAARDYLGEVLRRHQGRVAEAAEHAGVERESFYRLMRRYGVKSDE